MPEAAGLRAGPDRGQAGLKSEAAGLVAGPGWGPGRGDARASLPPGRTGRCPGRGTVACGTATRTEREEEGERERGETAQNSPCTREVAQGGRRQNRRDGARPMREESRTNSSKPGYPGSISPVRRERRMRRRRGRRRLAPGKLHMAPIRRRRRRLRGGHYRE